MSPEVPNLRTFSSVRIFFSQLDAFRLAVRQHAKFDDRYECCRQPEQPAMPTGPDARECQMPEQECWSGMSGNSGFEYAVSTVPGYQKLQPVTVDYGIISTHNSESHSDDAIHTPMPQLIWHTIHDQFHHQPWPYRASEALIP